MTVTCPGPTVEPSHSVASWHCPGQRRARVQPSCQCRRSGSAGTPSRRAGLVFLGFFRFGLKDRIAQARLPCGHPGPAAGPTTPAGTVTQLHACPAGSDPSYHSIPGRTRLPVAAAASAGSSVRLAGCRGFGSAAVPPAQCGHSRPVTVAAAAAAGQNLFTATVTSQLLNGSEFNPGDPSRCYLGHRGTQA